MQKSLIILPSKRPNKLIMKGFSRGFNANGFFVIKNDEKNIDSDFLYSNLPDIIIGYGKFIEENKEIISFKKQFPKTILISYFADNNLPTTPSQDIKYFVWDKSKEDDNFTYLPLGISSRTYYNDFESYKYFISFIGNPNNKKRLNIIQKIIKIYGKKFSIFCDKKDFDESIEKVQDFFSYQEFQMYKHSYKGFLNNEKEISKICNSSIINLNIINNSETSCNFRVFETLASGGFLLTNNKKAVSEFFEYAKDFESYENEEDLLDKIEFYLKNQDIAQRIAQNGRAKIKGKHTFAKRTKTILNKIK